MNRGASAKKFIRFRLAGQECVIESERVRESLPVPAVTPIPCSPAFLLGAAVWRGGLLPIVCFHDLLELGGLPVTTPTLMVVEQPVLLGLVVDSRGEELEMDTSSLHSAGAPTPLDGLCHGCIELEGRRLHWLDWEALLAECILRQLNGARAA